MEPASLDVVKHLYVEIRFVLAGVSFKPEVDLQEGALRAFSNLLTTLNGLETLTFAVKATEDVKATEQLLSTEFFTTDIVHDMWDWPKLARMLDRFRQRHPNAPLPSFVLEDITLKSNTSVDKLTDFISCFAKIESLYLQVSYEFEGFEIEPQSSLRLRALSNIENFRIAEIRLSKTTGNIAAALPTSALTLSEFTYHDGLEPLAFLQDLHFLKLRSVEIDCLDDPPAVLELLSLLNAPQLHILSLCNVATDCIVTILGPEFQSLLLRQSSIKKIAVGVISAGQQWLGAQVRLEDLRAFLHDMGKELILSLSYGGGFPPAKFCQAIPLTAPLYEHIEKLFISINDNCIQAPYRASRVRLPKVVELTLSLGSFKKRPIGVVQWFLDGLDLPALKSFLLLVSDDPRMMAPVIAYLPLLPSQCAVTVRCPWKGTATSFYESDQYNDILDMCANSGMDLVFDGDDWPAAARELRRRDEQEQSMQ